MIWYGSPPIATAAIKSVFFFFFFSRTELLRVDRQVMERKWIKGMSYLDKMNQALLLKVAVPNTNPPEGSFNINFTVSVLKFDSVDADNLTTPTSHVRKFTCKQGNPYCDNVYLYHVDFIKYSNYTLSVTLNNETDGNPSAATMALSQAYFAFEYYDEDFTLFELWFRFTFLILTFVVIIVFAHKLRQYRWTDWQVEQKWTAFILFGLMAANNPFFALELIFEGWFPVFLDQVMLVTFVSMLFLFWLVMFDGVRKDAVQRTLLKFYVPKVILVALFWITALVVFTLSELRRIDDPLYDETTDDPAFIFFVVTEIIIAVIYLFWLIYVVCRACQESRTFPLLGVRIRFFALFTLAVVIVMVSGIAFEEFGPTTAIKGNPMTLLAYLTLYNFYVYVLAFMYLPSRFAAKGAVRDNEIGMVRFEDEADSLEGAEEVDH